MANYRTFSHLFLGVSSLAFMATAANAQEGTAAESQNDGVIVVTAQKREQNLQEVPLAITAISGERLEQMQVTDTRDLSGLAPNVTIVQGTVSNSAAVFSIRGIASGSSETFGLDLASALYVDGVYIGRAGAAGLDVVDLQRVEVLRGPQGTLFGRNTTGGAIAFISRAPSNEFGLRAEAGYGSFNAWNGRISLDTGEIIPGVAATFSYSHRQRDGTVDNLLENSDSRDPGSNNSDSFRGALRIEPSDDSFIQYIFDWSEIRGNPSAFQLVATSNGAARPPVTIDGRQVVQAQPTAVQQYLAGATFLEAGCAALAVPTREYRETICLNSDEISTDKNMGHNLQIGNDFGGVAAKLTLGYREWDNDYANADLDGIGTIRGAAFSQATVFNGFGGTAAAPFLPFVFPAGTPQANIDFVANSPVPTTTANLFVTSNVRKHDQFSAELELAGDTESLDWVIGGFYYTEDGTETNPQTSAFVLDTNTRVFSNFGALAPAFQAANPARYRVVVTPAILRYTAEAESTALYGQLTVYPGGRDSGLSLTAGGRYTWDDKSIVRQQNGVAPVLESGEDSFSRFTWNLMGRYEFTPDVSVYARAATGYRSGGFNAGDPTVTGTTTIPSFNEETVNSYELGLKTELFNGALRLNLAGYHNVYNDLAVIQPVLASGSTFQSRITNAGKVNYTGFEADFLAQFSDNFSLDGSVGYVDVNYKEFFAGQPVVATDPVVNIASVITPGYTSPLTMNAGFNGAFPIGAGGMELRFRVSYTHEDGKYSFSNSISSPFNEQILGDDVDLIDAQLILENIDVGGADARIMIWGKNLTDDNNLVRGIDFGALGYAGGYFGDPRTYGVTLGIEF